MKAPSFQANDVQENLQKELLRTFIGPGGERWSFLWPDTTEGSLRQAQAIQLFFARLLKAAGKTKKTEGQVPLIQTPTSASMLLDRLLKETSVGRGPSPAIQWGPCVD